MNVLSAFQNDLFLSEEEKQTGFWVQDNLHIAHALSPLYASFQLPAMTYGTKQGFETLKLPIYQFVVKLADGKMYQQNIPFPGDVNDRLKEHQEAVKPLLPGLKPRLYEYVDEVFLPFYMEVKRNAERPLSLKEAEEKVKELHDFYKKAWQLHFEIVMPRNDLGMILEELYGTLTGDANTAYVYDLLEGVMNKSLETDQALWELTDTVKRSDPLKQAFTEQKSEEIEANLLGTAEGREFLKNLQSFLNEYGYRSANSHEFIDETWVENPLHALSIIAGYVRKDYDFKKNYEDVVKKREESYRDVLAKMPECKEKEQFKLFYGWALDAWGLDEDHHFYIDAMLPATARLFLLNVGTLLADHQVIHQPQDIFHFYYDELLEVLKKPVASHELIVNRKQEFEENRHKKTPPAYGTPPQTGEDPLLERVFGKMGPPEVDETQKIFKGSAASRGVYTGVVKIISDPSQFSKLEQGDILVCETTAPAWTTLFSLAGAIVTNAGGILSHAGTVAREYKLPAVLGTKVAVDLLKDGDVITVDGTNGVVTIEQQ